MKKNKKSKKIKEKKNMDYYEECQRKVVEKMADGREFYFETSSDKYLIKEFDEKNMKVLGENENGKTIWLYVTGYDFKDILKNIKPLRIRKKKRV